MTSIHNIRMMQRQDIPACRRLASIGFGSLFGELAHVDFNEMFGSAAWRPTFYVCEIANKIVGMGAYNIAWLGYGIYSLTWLAVHPEHRRKGIATALIERRLADLRPLARLILTETPREEVAVLYERLGFRRVLMIPGEQSFAADAEVLLAWTARTEGE